jgi:gas vesicle protein
MSTRDCSSFFAGLGAGIGIALVFAPKSGAQVRCGIQEKLDQGRQKLQQTKTAAYQAVEREKEGISAAVGAGRQAYREATGRAGNAAAI